MVAAVSHPASRSPFQMSIIIHPILAKQNVHSIST